MASTKKNYFGTDSGKTTANSLYKKYDKANQDKKKTTSSGTTNSTTVSTASSDDLFTQYEKNHPEKQKIASTNNNTKTKTASTNASLNNKTAYKSTSNVAQARQKLRNTYSAIVKAADNDGTSYSDAYDKLVGSPSTQEEAAKKSDFLKYAADTYDSSTNTNKHYTNKANTKNWFSNFLYGIVNGQNSAYEDVGTTTGNTLITDEWNANEKNKASLPTAEAATRAKRSNESRQLRYNKMSSEDLQKEKDTADNKQNNAVSNALVDYANGLTGDDTGLSGLFNSLIIGANAKKDNATNSDVLYYDADGNAVTYSTLIGQKNYERDKAKIDADANTSSAYNDYIAAANAYDAYTSIDTKKSREKYAAENGQYDILDQVDDVSGDQDQTRLDAYLTEKYGKTSADMDEWELANIMAQVKQNADANKKTLSDLGYDVDSLWEYEKREQDRTDAESKTENLETFAEEHPLAATLASTITAPAQSVEYVASVIGNEVNYGDNPYMDNNVYDMDFTNSTSALNTGAGTAAYNAVYNWTDSETAAWLAQQVYSGVSSSMQSAAVMVTASAITGGLGLPEVAAAKLGEALGLYVLGSQAAASSYQQSVKNGASNEQAFIYSLASGINEALFEKISFGELKSIQDIIDSGMSQGILSAAFYKAFLMQGLTEGSEEVFTDLANRLADDLINGDLSDYNQNVAKYEQMGYSADAADSLATKDFMQQLLESGLGGAFGGMTTGTVAATKEVLAYGRYGAAYGASKAINAAAETIEYNQTGKKAVDAQNTDVLINQAKSVTGNTEKASAARAAGEKLAAAVSEKKSDKAVKKQAGKTVKALIKYNTETAQNAGETVLKEVIREEVNNSGITGAKADTVASAIFKKVQSHETLTASENKAVSEVENSEDLIDRINERYASDEVTNKVKDAVVKARANSERVLSTSGDTISTKVNDTGEDLTVDGRKINVVGISKIKKVKGAKGKNVINITYKLDDGSTISSTDASLGSAAKALVYEGVARMGVTADTATKLVQGFTDTTGLTGDKYLSAIKQAYLSGYGGTELNTEGIVSMLSEAVRADAVAAGKQDARADTPDIDSLISNARAAYKSFFGNDGTINEGGVYLMDAGKYTVASNKAIKEYTQNEQTQIKVLRKIAENITHNSFVIFQSETNANGDRVFSSDVTDLKGKVIYHKGEHADNGFIRSDGTIYIDLNAGQNGEGVILWTAAHEVTHLMHDWNNKAFRELADFLISHYGSDTMNSLIDAKVKSQGISRSLAYEEVVADSMQMMFTDKNARIVMDQLVSENKSIADKLLDLLKNFADKIDAIYKDMPAQSYEAAMVKGWSDDVRGRLAELFGEGLAGAGSNYAEAVIDDEGHVGTDAIRGTQDGLVVQDKSKGTDLNRGEKTDWRRENDKPEPKIIRSLSATGKNKVITEALKGITEHYVELRKGVKQLAYTNREIREYAMRLAGQDSAIKNVNKFMDEMGAFMEHAGVTYKYIGLTEVENSQLHYTFNSDGTLKSIVLSAMIKNGEYPVNFDFTSICKKRVAMSAILDEIAKRHMLDPKTENETRGVYSLSQQQLFAINKELKDAGFETACLGCFVESKRYNIQKWAESFCDKYNEAVRKINPNATFFNFGPDTFNFDNMSDRQIREHEQAAVDYTRKTGEARREAKKADMQQRADEGRQFFPQYITAAVSNKIEASDKLTDEQKRELLYTYDKQKDEWVRATGRTMSSLSEKYSEETWNMLLGEKIINPSDLSYNGFSQTQIKKINESEVLTDQQKNEVLEFAHRPNDLSLDDVFMLIDTGVLAGKAIKNDEAIQKLVSTSEDYQHILRPSDLMTKTGITQLEMLPNFHGVLYGHYGSGTPKLIQGFTPYNSEIALLPAKKGQQGLAEYLYTIAGARMQSFSDFQIQNIYDYLQMISDMSARSIPAHAYTKEISFGELMGMSGIKVNLSVMFDIDVDSTLLQQAIANGKESAEDVIKAHAGLTLYNPAVHTGEYAKVVYEDEYGKWVYNVGDLAMQRAYENYNKITGNSAAAKRFLQSIGFADAIKLQQIPGYTSNIGIIGVGYSRAHIIAMLNDPRIRYIIPYHASSLPEEIALATNIKYAKDYTSTQNNMKIVSITDRNEQPVEYDLYKRYRELHSGIKVIQELNDHIQKDGWKVTTKKAQNGHGKFMLYETLENEVSPYQEIENFIGTSGYNDPRLTAETYMAWCCSNRTLPVFYEFIDSNIYDGDFNYYKVVYDFNVYDNVTGEYAPQKAVENIFPAAAGVAQNVNDGNFDSSYFQSRIEKYMAWQNGYNESLEGKIPSIVDKIENDTLGKKNGVSFLRKTGDKKSSRVTQEDNDEYMRLAADPEKNRSRLQALVDKAAELAGYKVAGYHGTLSGGFNVFDKHYARPGGNSGAGFYFSSNVNDSTKNYSDVEGADNYFKASSLADQIIDMGEWNGEEIDDYDQALAIAKKELTKKPQVYSVALDMGNTYIRDGLDSTNLMDNVEDGFDQSVIDRKDYDSDEEYDDAVQEEYYDYIDNRLSEVIFAAFDDLKNNYDNVYISDEAGLCNDIMMHALDYGSLYWDDINNAASNYTVTVFNDDWNDEAYADPELARLIVKRLGYDSITDKEVSQKFGQLNRNGLEAEHYIMFNSNQIKLNDPVTYDDAGNVIPLAERFNSKEPDIRKQSRNNKYFDYDKPITDKDILALRKIGIRKSVKSFSQEDIRKARKWAYKYWKQMGVKSPFFRAWFGDWREYDTKNAAFVIEVNSSDVRTINNTTRNIKNLDAGFNLIINKDSIGDSIHYAITNNRKQQIKRLLCYIDEIAEKSILLDTQTSDNAKNNKKGNTSFMHYLYAIVSVNGAPFLAKLTVEEYDTNNKTRAYNLNRIEMSDLQRAQFSEILNENRGIYAYKSDWINVAQLYSFVKKYDKNFVEGRPVDTTKLDSQGLPKENLIEEFEGKVVFDRGVSVAGTDVGRFKSNRNIGTFDNSNDLKTSKRYTVEELKAKNKALEKENRNNLKAYYRMVFDAIDAAIPAAANKADADWLKKYQEALTNVNQTRSDLETARRTVRMLTGTGADADSLAAAKNNVKTLTSRLNSQNARLDKLGQAQPVQAVLADAMKQHEAQIRQQFKEQRQQDAQELLETKRHYQEQRAKATDKRHSSATREKIRTLLNDFNRRLTNPTEGHYIPQSMKGVVAELLNAVEFATPGTKLSDKLASFKNVYEQILKTPEENIYADPVILDAISEAIDTVGDTQFNDLSAYQAETLYNTMKALDYTIRNAVKVKGIETEQDAFQFAAQMIDETDSIPKKKTNYVSRFLQTQLRPQAMFARLGNHIKNSNWSKLYKLLDDGQLKQTRLLMEGQMMFAEVFSKANRESLYALSDIKNTVDIGLVDRDGNPVKITRGMMLSVYRALLNEDNARHIMYGGYTVPDLKQYYKNGDDPYGAGKTRTAPQSQTITRANNELDKAKSAQRELMHQRTEIREAIKEAKRNDNRDTIPDLQNKLDALDARITAMDDEITSRTADVVAAQVDMTDYIEGMKARIEQMLTPFERRLLDIGAEFFDNWSKNVLNATTMEEYGFEKASVDNYMPIHTDKNFLGASFDQVTRDMSLENVGFMKSRIHGTNPIMLEDFTEVINRQIKSVAQYAGMMPAIRQFNRIYGKNTSGYENSVQGAVDSKFGKYGLRYVSDLMSDLVGARAVKDATLFDQLLNKTRGHMAQAALSLTPRVALAQAASYPTAAAEIGWKPLIKALAKGGKGNSIISGADRDLIAKYSPLLWYRMQGYSTQEIGDAKDAAKIRNRLENKTKWLMGWISAMDGATVGRLWYAAQYYVDENSNLAKGSDAYYEKVAEVFNNIVEKTQPNYTTMQRPDALRTTNAIMKSLSMFMTQRLQNFNIVYDSAATLQQYSKDYKAGKNDVTEEDVRTAKNDVVRAVTSQVFAAVTIVAIKAITDVLMHSVNGYRDDDDELTEESILAKLLDNLIDTIVSSVQFGSETYNLVKALTGISDQYDPPEITGFQTFADIAEEIADLGADAWEDGIPTKKLRNLAISISELSGIPVANARKIVMAAVNWTKDAIHGELWSFEAGVERTPTQNGNIYYNAITSGDTEKAAKYEEILGEDKANETVYDRVKKDFAAGNIDAEEAEDLLEKYAGKDSDDAYWAVEEWEYNNTDDSGEDYNKYADFDEAVNSGGSLTTVIKDYTDKGITKEQLHNEVANIYREDYVAAKTSSAKNAILQKAKKANSALGYTTVTNADGYMSTCDDGWPKWTSVK